MTGEDRTAQDRTGQDMTGQGAAGQRGTGQARPLAAYVCDPGYCFVLPDPDGQGHSICQSTDLHGQRRLRFWPRCVFAKYLDGRTGVNTSLSSDEVVNRRETP